MFENDEAMDETYEDHPLDETVRRLAQDYNAPPPTPRDAMWERIRAARAATAPTPAPTPVVSIDAHRARRAAATRRAGWAAGIAAVLLLGIGIGRAWEHNGGGSAEGAPRGAAVAAAPTNEAAPSTAERLAVSQHLGQSEAFLTLFRTAAAPDGETQRLAAATAGRLLSTNRLLIDSPTAASDPAMRRLLQDLELVLAQIAQLQTVDRAAERRLEVELITEGLNDTDVMLRLRAAVPAGDVNVTTTAQGVL
jgi:hypothetical protein